MRPIFQSFMVVGVLAGIAPWIGPRRALADRPVRVDHGQYVNAPLNLHAQLPEGFDAESDRDATELKLMSPKTGEKAVFKFIDVEPKRELEGLVFSAITNSLSSIENAKDKKLVSTSNSDIELSVGAGHERSWKLEGTPYRVRLVFVRTCGGKAGITFFELWKSEATKATFDRWIQSFAAMEPGESAVCHNLPAPGTPAAAAAAK